jgi:hypothetical protein
MPPLEPPPWPTLSRKDKTFAQVLHQALADSKYDAWLDWQGIPPTAAWWQEAECIAPTGCMRLEICSAVTLSHQSGHTVVMRSPILQLLPR